MAMTFLLRRLVIGFSIAAPVGPIGVLCIRHTLAKGRTYGLICGLGAATADAMYGCIAAFGLTVISRVLIRQQVWLLAVGGAFLWYLGLKIFLARPAEEAAPAPGNGLFAAYATTFGLTLTNLLTILSFGAIFAGLGLAGASMDYVAAALLVSGVFIGSALWWLILSGIVGALRTGLDAHKSRWVNRASGIIIMGFGLLALLSVIGQ